MAAKFWIVVVWVVTLCSLVGFSVSEEFVSSIYPQDGGYTFLQNVGNHLKFQIQGIPFKMQP
jgi:hypothetical protein